MKALRQEFGDYLLESGSKNSELVVVSCDLQSATGIKKFASTFPERLVETGIAEANGVGIAAGLALSGFRTIITSFGSFLTGKNIEIRISIAYNNAPVILVGTHGGLIGPDGATQSGTQDLAVMRSIPGVEVFQPATPKEVRAVLDHCMETLKPTYVRISRNEVAELHQSNFIFEVGRPYIIKEGNEILVISSGPVVHNCLEAAKQLEGQLSIKVVNLITIKPIDVSKILDLLKGIKLVIIFEDHEIHGGIGSAFMESVANQGFNIPIYNFGLNNQFVNSDTPKNLEKIYQLDSDGIKKTILDTWEKFV